MWYPEALATHEEVVQDRELFQRTLQELLHSMGVKLKIPKVNNVEVDLHLLYKEVTTLGGIENVINRKQWVVVCEPFHFPSSFTNKSFVIKKLYTNALQTYEDIYFHRRQGLMASPHMGISGDMSSGEARAKRKAEYQSESGLAGPVTVLPLSGHPIPGRSSSSGSLSAPSTLEAGTQFSGVIDCHFDQGYMITLNLPNQKLHGVLYKQAPPHLTHPALLNRAREDTAISQELESGLDLGKRFRADPNHPRPQRTPFQFFQLGVNKEQLLQLHPDPNAANPKELLPKLMSDLWHQMSPEQRRPFQAMGDKDAERYDKEWAEFCRRVQAQASGGAEEPHGHLGDGGLNTPPAHFGQQLLSGSPGASLHTPPAAARRPPHPPRHMRISIPLKQRATALPLSQLGMAYFPSHQTYAASTVPTHHGHLAHHHTSMPPPQPSQMPSRLLSAPGYALLPPDMEPEELEHLCYYPQEHQALQQDFRIDQQQLHDDHEQLMQGLPDEDRLGPSMAHDMHGRGMERHEEEAFDMTLEALQDHEAHEAAAAAAAAGAPCTDIDIFGCSTTIKVTNPGPKADAMGHSMQDPSMHLADDDDAHKQQNHHRQQPHHHQHQRQQHHLPCMSGQDIASTAGSPSDTVSHAFHRERANGSEPGHYAQVGEMMEQDLNTLPHMFD